MMKEHEMEESATPNGIFKSNALRPKNKKSPQKTDTENDII